MGVVSLPSARSARSQTSPGRVSERRTLPLWDLGREVLSKNAESLRDSDAHDARRCPAGVAAPLGCVIFFYFCQNCDFYALRTQGLSVCARRGWYHYPRRALRVLETPDGRLSKRLICRFLRSGGRSSPHDVNFLANTQNFMLAVPVANVFALWYDKFSKLKVVRYFYKTPAIRMLIFLETPNLLHDLFPKFP